MKKILVLLLCLVLVFTFAACSGAVETTGTTKANETTAKTETTKETEAEKVELTFWHLSYSEEQFNTIIPEFMAEYPNIEVKMTYNPTNDMTRNLTVLATADSMPDMWFTWGGALGEFFPENGLAMDLNEYAAKAGWDSFFKAAAMDLCKYDGSLYGFPITINNMGVFYVKSVFDELNISEPTTMEELDAVCATLKDNDYIPWGMCGRGGWHLMRLVEALIEAEAGAEVHDRLIALDADAWVDPGVVKAYEKYLEYVQNDYFYEGFLNMETTGNTNRILTKQAIMAVEGPWFARNAISANSDDYDYFKFPSDRLSSFAEMIQFNAKLTDAEFDAAMTFLNYVYSKEVMTKHNVHFKFPSGLLDDMIPAEHRTTFDLVDDAATYGVYTISDQAFPAELMVSFYQVQDQIALGEMTAQEAAEFMKEATKTYLASQ